MKPIETHLEQPAPNEAIVCLYLDPDLNWFRGHFSVQPLFPGVAQIDWVMHYAQTLLAPGWNCASVEMVKFQLPLQPEDNLRLKIHWEETKHLLTFQYDVESPTGSGSKTASQGKIKLCR